MAQKIKVLQFCVRAPLGGIERYIFENWKHIDRTRFSFDFVSRSPKCDIQKYISPPAGIFELTSTSGTDKINFFEQMENIISNGYDVIHIHTSYWTGFDVEKLARKAHIPKIIIHAHSTGIDYSYSTEQKEALENKHEQLRESFFPELATNFCACSAQAAAWLFGERVPEKNIQLLRDAIDVQKFSFNHEIRNALRQRMGFDGKFVIGSVGRISYQKNQEFLLQIMREIMMIRPDAVLMQIGAGPMELQIKNYAEKLGLNDRVCFLGERQDVHELMQAMDCFVLPSRFEGLGIVYIEAQAAGLPCFASEWVPLDASVTPNLHYISLNVSASGWAKKILDVCEGFHRVCTDELVRSAGYDIRYQIKKVEQLYTN